jgi:hypothetical protein
MLHRVSPLIVAALASLALVAFSENQALAWGNEGHRLVCQIALDRLTPAGQAFLDSVRALESDIEDPFEDCQSCSPNHPSDGRTMSFLESCIWPDESRRDTTRLRDAGLCPRRHSAIRAVPRERAV